MDIVGQEIAASVSKSVGSVLACTPNMFGLAAGPRRAVAEGFVTPPQLFITAAAGLTHNLRLMRIVEPFGDGLALRTRQAGVGDLLDTAAHGPRGRRAVGLPTGALNQASLSRKGGCYIKGSRTECRGQNSFHHCHSP